MNSQASYFSLQGKVIVITGGAGFLGVQHAEAILESGGIPVLLDVNEQNIESRLVQLQQEFPGCKVYGAKVDITDKTQVEAVCQDLVEKFGHVDGLINNASNNPSVGQGGLVSNGRFETFALEQWNEDIAVGLTGALICSQVFGAQMVAQKSGAIVNISSDLGIISPDQRLYEREGVPKDEQDVKPVTYSVVKTALLGLTRYLATYWANEGVRVNAVVFGGVRKDQNEEFLRRVESRIPLGRMAESGEYKGTIIYLLSEASSYMTGSTMVVDGGRTIW